MRNIKLTIEYDGTHYHGWQSQINAPAVQDAVEKALRRLTGEDCRLTGASRTDVGVHALGQVANFYTRSPIPADKFSYALNSLLPADIVIRTSCEVESDFHSRFFAQGKMYRYLIYNSNRPSALLRHRACFVPQPLDVERMGRAAQFFLGTHDFSAFRATGSNTKTSTRTMFRVSVRAEREPAGVSGVPMDPPDAGDWDRRLILFEIVGDGFLYNMVRIMAGTLIEVGLGKMSPEDALRALESGERDFAGRTAPSHGLYLVEVYYETVESVLSRVVIKK